MTKKAAAHSKSKSGPSANYRTISGPVSIDGKTTGLYVLTNKSGMEVCITNFGGCIVSVMAPDKDGGMRDVVLGFDNIHDYLTVPSDFGASIGRYANRINKGHIVLDGTVKGKHGLTYNFRTAVCLETQKYPDTPNKKDWPSAELRPGETYFSRCIYRFSVAE